MVASISYSLQPYDGFGLFSIDSATALLRVSTSNPDRIDFERLKIYELKVGLSITCINVNVLISTSLYLT